MDHFLLQCPLYEDARVDSSWSSESLHWIQKCCLTTQQRRGQRRDLRKKISNCIEATEKFTACAEEARKECEILESVLDSSGSGIHYMCCREIVLQQFCAIHMNIKAHVHLWSKLRRAGRWGYFPVSCKLIGAILIKVPYQNSITCIYCLTKETLQQKSKMFLFKQ